MDLIRKSLRAVGHAGHLFFRSQLKLRWRRGVRVEFVERDGQLTASPEALARQARRTELSRIVGELAQCLDADADIRPELRHLAYLETALRQQGLEALQNLPLDVLQKALDQFEGLVSNWSPWGLATLRSKMAVALAERAAVDEPAAASSSSSPSSLKRSTV
ncbi:MAG: hypothetical protein H6933_14880 [Burkholderiaceae bacterium]|nr:hypothetical protein [Rhodoferax sp.]MCP5286172.1 hypothetical protein [Burkholderiaceae bacterium]